MKNILIKIVKNLFLFIGGVLYFFFFLFLGVPILANSYLIAGLILFSLFLASFIYMLTKWKKTLFVFLGIIFGIIIVIFSFISFGSRYSTGY